MKLTMLQRFLIKRAFGKEWVQPIEKFLSLFDTPERAMGSFGPIAGEDLKPGFVSIGENGKVYQARVWALAPEPPIEHKPAVPGRGFQNTEEGQRLSKEFRDAGHDLCSGGSTTLEAVYIDSEGKKRFAVFTSDQNKKDWESTLVSAGWSNDNGCWKQPFFGIDASGKALPASDVTTTRYPNPAENNLIADPWNILTEPEDTK